MSSLAEILVQRGFEVCGSDMQSSYTTESLVNMGAKVFIGHCRENILSFSPDAVVKTDAIMPDNPELICSRECGIPVFRRAELLGEILDGYSQTIGVAGTHGKTTTTSMITSVFLENGKTFSSIIGGIMKQLGKAYIIGSDDGTCIFESCEFRDSFLNFRPDISVVLNIAEDHMEYFKTKENLICSFKRYLGNTKPGGTVVYNCEDENSLIMVEDYTGKRLSYGLSEGDFHSSSCASEKGLYSFDLIAFGENKGKISLSVPGAHNVKNAVAAACACYAAGLPFDVIRKGLSAYKGAKRRFEYHCVLNGAIVADDYGHHPDAYDVTFRTARDLGFKRIIAIHQPHTFSRTQMLMDDFVSVLSTVDKVLIPPIYPAREKAEDFDVRAEDLVARLPNAEFCPDFDSIAERVNEIARPGDLFITLGCGNIYLAAELITKKYGNKI